LNYDLDGDVLLGRLDDPSNRQETLSFTDATKYNSVMIRIRCTGDRGQQSPLFFARVLGFDEFDTVAEATATFDDSVTGFQITQNTGNCSLMPFAILEEDWINQVLDGWGTDDWSYDLETRTVSSGPDGIPEMTMYPVDMNDSDFSIDDNTGSGNWTTLDIGGGDNSTAVLERQILEGVSAEDLADLGRELRLDPTTGTLDLTADTGISVGMKDALESVVGQPRTIALYDLVTDGGNNMIYRIVGFVGIRVTDLRLTGANARRYVVIQPAYVCDPTAVTDSGIGRSYFVGKPIHLCR
jgi:hypothetical protein